MTRPFDFSQLPAGGVTILPALPPDPTPGDALIVDTVAPDGRVSLVFAPVAAGGGGGTTTVTISDTPPLDPLPGALWFDSMNAQLFMRYADSNSAQWVVANTVGPATSGGETTGVASFNTRTGSVVLTQADVTAVLPPADTVPVMDGTAAAGTAITWSRQDHRHPTDTSRAPLLSPIFAGTPFLPTGTTGVTQPPGTANLSMATTEFVITSLGAVPGGAVIADAPPVLNPGGLWWDSAGGQLYVRYDDGNSEAYVAATNVQGLANAATKAEVGAALNNSGRNLIHNGQFNVAQRGPGQFTVNGTYSADRWILNFDTDTMNVVVYAMVDGDRNSIGDESARYALGNTFTGSAAASAFNAVIQRMEDVRRFAGKTVIVSFWAKLNAGPATKLGVSIDQVFGTGGSPSPYVAGVGQSITLTGLWQRYSLQIAVPSVNGKTFGTTAGSDWSQLSFWCSSGATNATRAGNVGVQSGNIALWGVQLEIAAAGQTQPSPLDKPDPQVDLANCQRFYQVGYAGVAGYNVAGQTIMAIGPLRIRMRATPTIVNSGVTQTNCSGSAASAFGDSGSYQMITTATATGQCSCYLTYAASADL